MAQRFSMEKTLVKGLPAGPSCSPSDGVTGLPAGSLKTLTILQGSTLHSSHIHLKYSTQR